MAEKGRSNMLGDRSKLEPEDSLRLIEELQLNLPEEAKAKRIRESYPVKVACTLVRGNISERGGFKAEGTTREVARNRVVAVFPHPIAVGDVYLVTFDSQMLDLPTCFVQCNLCRMLQDDAFEVGLTFFKAVELPASVQTG